MSVDKWLDRKFVRRKYTCHNFADDVWTEVTGKSLGAEIIAFLDKGKTFVGMRQGFVRLKAPIDPCIALFKPKAGRDHHVGIYMRGRILHLGENGVKFQKPDAAVIGFKEIRFYECPSK